MSIQRYEYLGMQSGDMRINGLFHRKNSGASSAVDNMFFASFMKNVHITMPFHLFWNIRRGF